jgi:hypothetical protein
MINPFRKYFEPEQDDDAADLTEIHQILEFARCPYFEKFIAYLERGADAKLDVSTETTMLSSAERINTFKDIKTHLRKQVRDAGEILSRETSGD